MKITRVYTHEPIQSLGVNSSFTATSSCVITIAPTLQCIRINSTLIPLSSVREIVIDDSVIEEIKERDTFEVKEPKVKTKKAD
jgi:hypothetical protein